MIFNKHFDLSGRHAVLSASKYHWTNYDEEKMEQVYVAELAARRGSDLHDLADRLIKLGVRLPKERKTLNMYVNDAIGYRMSSEQVLYYSDNAFGTADAIKYGKEKGVPTLRIHDLKTGIGETSVKQLLIYAAFFCLEYLVKPFEVYIELRIYQNNEVRIYEGDPDEVFHIMDKIVTFNKRIEALRMEALP